ncbi:MAG: hypothetical protein WCA63_02885, partial [Gallionella sp.]
VTLSPPQTGTGALSSVNPVGTYAVLASSDGYIQGGKVFPIANGVMVGNVALNSTNPVDIPVFSIPNPITTLLSVDNVYNYQGFTCGTTGNADVTGVSGCASQLYGTMSITGYSSTGAVYTDCKDGNFANQNEYTCSPISYGSIQASSFGPGVYQVNDSGNNQIGWFFAFTAPNGQIVGVIDHNYTCTPTPCTTSEYGFTVLTSYAPVLIGNYNGSYMVETNENQEQWVTIETVAASGVIPAYTSYTSTAQSGVAGTLTPNWPWNGLSAYNIPASAALGFPTAISGVAMVTGTGAYTHTSPTNDTKLFAVGVRYGP